MECKIKNNFEEIKKDTSKNENGITVKKISNSDEDVNVKSGDKKGKVRKTLGDDSYKVEIQKADKFFRTRKWAESNFHYENALKIKPDDEYAKKKLEEIKAILQPKK